MLAVNQFPKIKDDPLLAEEEPDFFFNLKKTGEYGWFDFIPNVRIQTLG
jgi:hypothetical protein